LITTTSIIFEMPKVAEKDNCVDAPSPPREDVIVEILSSDDDDDDAEEESSPAAHATVSKGVREDVQQLPPGWKRYSTKLSTVSSSGK
jgi:hypothetical protein